MSRAGFLLAGGNSTRMGVDKVFLEFGGETLLDHGLKVIAAVCPSVTIVGDPAKFAGHERAKSDDRNDDARHEAAKCESLKCESVVGDVFPECGPLGGIHTALAHSVAELNLMLAVDMPWVSAELLTFLFAVAESNEATVTVPSTRRGLQPLCAIYRRDFLPVAEEALRAGKYKIDVAFSAVSTHVVAAAELASAGFSEQSFFNVNTPQDRLAAENGYRRR